VKHAKRRCRAEEVPRIQVAAVVILKSGSVIAVRAAASDDLYFSTSGAVEISGLATAIDLEFLDARYSTWAGSN